MLNNLPTALRYLYFEFGCQVLCLIAKYLSLRGIPTTILFNKEGKEFARVIGYIDFNDDEFVKWLSNYN